MNKVYIIPIHSIIDVITNSSTEVFANTHGNSMKMAKELVNKILKPTGKTIDDYFEVKEVPAIQKMKEDNPDQNIEDFDDDPYYDDSLVLIPKNNKQETIDLIDEMRAIFNLEERAC